MDVRYGILFVILSVAMFGCASVPPTKSSSMQESSVEGISSAENCESLENKESSGKITTEEQELFDKCESVEKAQVKKESVENSKFSGTVLAGSRSQYLIYGKDDYEKALREHKTIILNFYANWCPLCKEEQPEAFSAFNELNDSTIVGFRVNFKDPDTDADEESSAKQFGIPYQHTKVILKDGKKVLKSLESWDKKQYLDELAKVK